MKKLLLMLVLLLSFTVYAQALPEKRVFQNVSLMENGGSGAKETTVEAINTVWTTDSSIKLLAANNEVMYFDRLSSFEEGKTDDGFTFIYAVYEKRDTKAAYLIQTFDDKRWGIRFIMGSGSNTIQMY